MPHCPPELLDDLADLLDEVRNWPGVVEKAPAVFYLRREPFLHFHLLASGQRRGDVKSGSDWVQVDLPRPITGARRRELLNALRAAAAVRAGATASSAAAVGPAPMRRATPPAPGARSRRVTAAGNAATPARRPRARPAYSRSRRTG